MTAGSAVDNEKSICGKIGNKSCLVYIILISFWIFVCAVSYFLLCISPVCDYDESYTVSMISHSFSDIVKITSQDVHSPVYYFLVKLFSFLPGIDYVHAPKLFSYLCTIAFLILFSAVVYKRYGGRASLYSVIIASATPMMISQVSNGRMYAAGLLFYFLAFYTGYLLSEEVSVRRIVVFTVSSVITVYLHHVFMTMTVLMFICFIVYSLVKKEYKRFRLYLCCGIITGSSFLPGFFEMLGQFKNRNSSGSLMHPLSDVSWYREYFVSWKDELFSGTFFVNGWMTRFWIVLFVLMIPGLILYYLRNKKDMLPVLGLLLLILTFLIPGMILLMFSGQFFARYAFPAYSGIWIGIAVILSFDLFENKALKTLYKVSGVLILIIAVYFGVRTYEAQYRGLHVSGIDDYLSCMDEVEDGDAVMFSDTWSSIMQIYDPDEEYWIYGHNPQGMPFYYKGVYTNKDQFSGYSRVWIIGNDMIEIANMGEGYTEIKRVEFDHHSYHFIVKLYEKS